MRASWISIASRSISSGSYWLRASRRVEMFAMRPVCNSFQKVLQARRTAAVLRRTMARAINEDGIIDSGLAGASLFDDNFVSPVVTEVVNVIEPVDAMLN